MQPPNAEKSTWSIFYMRFAPTIFAYLSRQMVNQQDAEDLLLEVFLRASQEAMLEEMPEERQLAWLRRVARNKVVDYYRHQRLISWLPLPQASELVDERLAPEERAEQQEAYTWLFLALKRLSPGQQELIRLRYGDELRLAEIAGIMGRPEGTVRKMLTRTRRQLRTYYEQLERGQEQ